MKEKNGSLESTDVQALLSQLVKQQTELMGLIRYLTQVQDKTYYEIQRYVAAVLDEEEKPN